MANLSLYQYVASPSFNNYSTNESALLTVTTANTLSSENFIVIAFFMVLIFVLGLSENSLSLFVFFRTKSLWTTNNIFIVGLLLSDWSQSVFGIPLVVISSIARHWTFGHGLCIYYGFVTTFLGITQVTTLTAISLDKYFVIVRKAQMAFLSKKKAVFIILLCYLHGFLWALFPILAWSSYQLEGANVSCSVHWQSKDTNDVSYCLALTVFGWILPLLAIVYSYSSICLLLRTEARKPVRRNLKLCQKKKQMNREKSVAITVLIMIGAFVISWMPYSIVSLIVVFGDPKDIPLTVTMVPALFAKSSIIWNPIIYVARHNDFRRACLKFLPNCGAFRKIRKLSRPSTSATTRGTSEYFLVHTINSIKNSSKLQPVLKLRLNPQNSKSLSSADVDSSSSGASSERTKADKSCALLKSKERCQERRSTSTNTDIEVTPKTLSSFDKEEITETDCRMRDSETRDRTCRIQDDSDSNEEHNNEICRKDITTRLTADESDIYCAARFTRKAANGEMDHSLISSETMVRSIGVQTSLRDISSDRNETLPGYQTTLKPRIFISIANQGCPILTGAKGINQSSKTNVERLFPRNIDTRSPNTCCHVEEAQDGQTVSHC